MSRVKEFDENEVLDRALELFRHRGYKHTSFTDLTQELGVSRQSLYDTYGDKQELYQTALKRYVERGIDKIRRLLEGPVSVKEAFHRLFMATIDQQCADGAPGCLLVNSMVELSPHDSETRAVAKFHARELQTLFASRLVAAQRRGDLRPEKDPVLIARMLYHTILGLAVAARAFGEKKALKSSAEFALRCLN